MLILLSYVFAINLGVSGCCFQDFVDLDEDSLPNGTASDSLVEGKGKVNFSLPESKSTASESVKLEKASALTEDKPVTSEMNRKTEIGHSTGAMAAEKSSSLIFQNTSSPSATVMPTVINTESSLTSDIGTLVKDSNASPIFNFGGKIPSGKDPSAASPATGAASYTKLETSSK